MESRTIVGHEMLSNLAMIRKEIKDLVFKNNLSKEDLKQDGCYAVLIPNTFKVKDVYITKHLKMAIERIAYYYDLTDSLAAISAILRDIEDANKDQNLKPVSDFISKIKNSIQDLSEKKTFSSTELSSYFKSLESVSSELQKIMKQNFGEKINSYLGELAAWIDGFYLHLSILIRRKEIQESIVDTKPEMAKKVPHPVEERKTSITMGADKALKKLGEADDRELLAMMLTVLSEIRKNVANDSSLKSSIDAIDYCFQVIFDENETRNKSNLDQLTELGNSKDKIIPNLEKFLSELNKISIAHVNAQSYEELAFYLEAKYFEAYKDSKKRFFWDIKDDTIKKKTNGKVTRMMIADFYHQAALVVEGKLSALQNKIDDHASKKRSSIDIDQISPQSGERDSASELKQLIDTVKDPRRISLLIESAKIISNMPLEENADMSVYVELMRNVFLKKEQKVEINAPSVTQEVNEEAFWQILDEAAASKEKTKIEALLNAFQRYGLSENQKNRLRYLDQSVPALFMEYKNNRYFWQKFVSSIPMVGSFLDPYLQRANIDVADQTLKSNSSDAENDPIAHIKNLFMARLMLSGRNSNDLSPKIDQLLEGIYTHLHNNRPSKLQEKQSTIAYGSHPNVLFSQSQPTGQIPSSQVDKKPIEGQPTIYKMLTNS